MSQPGWWSLVGILQQQRDNEAWERTRVPSACPHDGEPLTPAPDGGLFCHFDGYRWPDDGGPGTDRMLS